MKRNKAPAWPTADGRIIPITELGDKHLVNILHVIEESLSLFKPASETPLRDGESTEASLNRAANTGVQLPDGGHIIKVEHVSDGSREYTIRYTAVKGMPDPKRYRYEGAVIAHSGRQHGKTFVNAVRDTLHSSLVKKNLSDDRLLMYGALVVEAVRRGLFTWVQDRKYLSGIALKIADKVGE